MNEIKLKFNDDNEGVVPFSQTQAGDVVELLGDRVQTLTGIVVRLRGVSIKSFLSLNYEIFTPDENYTARVIGTVTAIEVEKI